MERLGRGRAKPSCKFRGSVPNTGLAVTIDIGEEQNIHPRNKRDVGYRLALNALANTYGRDVEWSGPQYELFDIEGHAIRVRFLHCSGGLQAKGGPLRQFSIAGSDGKFVSADAKIEGDCVVVTSPAVRDPVAVRVRLGQEPGRLQSLQRRESAGVSVPHGCLANSH